MRRCETPSTDRATLGRASSAKPGHVKTWYCCGNINSVTLELYVPIEWGSVLAMVLIVSLYSGLSTPNTIPSPRLGALYLRQTFWGGQAGTGASDPRDVVLWGQNPVFPIHNIRTRQLHSYVGATRPSTRFVSVALNDTSRIFATATGVRG